MFIFVLSCMKEKKMRTRKRKAELDRQDKIETDSSNPKGKGKGWREALAEEDTGNCSPRDSHGWRHSLGKSLSIN